MIALTMLLSTATCTGTIAESPRPSQTVAFTALPSVSPASPSSRATASPTSQPTARETTTAEDERLVAAFVTFARTPDARAFASLPLADEVGLALDDQMPLPVPATTLARPQGWVLDVREFNGWAGPFSALDLLARDTPTTISIGPHARCPGPVVPTPAALAGLRRISVQPKGTDTCLKWWSVDLFVSSTGRVTTVSLDLGSP